MSAKENGKIIEGCHQKGNKGEETRKGCQEGELGRRPERGVSKRGIRGMSTERGVMKGE